MANIMKEQDQASRYRGLPVDSVGASQTIVSVSGETVQLYYYNSGALTADAGQAAGTIVVGQLANAGVKNELGSMCATDLDTSLSFTSTALTTEVAFPFDFAEANDSTSGTTRAQAITNGMSQGDYCVDYVNGLIYGIKASTTTTLTSTAYKIQKEITGGGGGVAEDVNINEVGGTATAVNAGTANNGTLRVIIASDQSSIPVTTTPVENSAITSGSKSVTSAGTAEALVGGSTPANSVIISALLTNTGTMYIGGATVDSTNGIPLDPGDAVVIEIDDLNVIYVDSSVNAEGVTYNYLT